jgi:hypothetical protein
VEGRAARYSRRVYYQQFSEIIKHQNKETRDYTCSISGVIVRGLPWLNALGAWIEP